MRDVLKLAAGPAVSGGGTSEYAFFSGDQERVDDALVYSYWQAAAASAAAAVAVPGFAVCQSGEADAVCAERLLTNLATRAFRRPLSAEESSALLSVFTAGQAQSFTHGVELAIAAILQSPSFVYRTELGVSPGTTALTPFETASQLSYLLLDSVPDEPLLAAAQAGSLGTPAGVGAEFDRVATLPQARANITRIVEEWFGTRRASTVQKDATLFPDWNTTLSADLIESAHRFIDDTLWGGSHPLEDLATSRRVFVNQRLGSYYGLDGSVLGTDLVAQEFPANQPRAGLLTHPAMLAAVSGVGKTSVVHRGLYVRKEVICADPVPGPPPGLLDDPTIKDALSKLPTERAAADYRLANTICTGCHSVIDPFGLLFEHFDPVGRYRDTADGQTIDQSATLSLSPTLPGKVDGPVALAQGIVQDGVFAACATRKLSSYALGRTVAANNTCELDTVQARYQNSDHSVYSLLREIALSSFMQTRGAMP